MTERHVNREAALQRVGGDLELLQEIARLFLDDTQSMMSAIENAASARDAKGLERAAHTLKGSVANFGAPESYEAALSLEKLGRASDFTGVSESLERLRQSLDGLRPELEALAEG